MLPTVAPWWKKPCPNCGQVKLGSYNQPGAGLAGVLTGKFFIGGAKAVLRLAQGGASAYDWINCGNCAGVYLACQNCATVFRPSAWPEYGDSVRCPGCGLDLV
jgi:hypothetical protein